MFCSCAKVKKKKSSLFYLGLVQAMLPGILGGGKTPIRVIVQNNTFVLRLVSSWGLFKGMAHCHRSPDSVQIPDLDRGQSPGADSEAGGV